MCISAVDSSVGLCDVHSAVDSIVVQCGVVYNSEVCRSVGKCGGQLFSAV